MAKAKTEKLGVWLGGPPLFTATALRFAGVHRLKRNKAVPLQTGGEGDNGTDETQGRSGLSARTTVERERARQEEEKKKEEVSQPHETAVVSHAKLCRRKTRFLR